MIYNTTPLYNYQFVSLQINSITSRYYFPDLPNLRDVKTYCISTYNSDFIEQDINNVNIISRSDMSHAYITLYAENREKFQRLDLSYFCTLINYAGLVANYGSWSGSLPIDFLKIDFSKSFIEFNSGYTPATTPPFVIPFGIYYIKA
jgi:hypothetical protein